MSRTKGINSEIRHPLDEYITPPWCVERLFEAYPLPPGLLLCDPCASRGELLSTVRALRPDLRLMGVEINPECAPQLVSVCGGSHIIGDFLKLPTPKSPGNSIILTNPPYSLAQDFIEHSLKFSTLVIMLLRLNFLVCRDRRGFTERTNPGVFVLPNRPSFNGRGSDGTEYGWFVYGDPDVAGTWKVLFTSPPTQISEWNQQMRRRYPKSKETT
jgi:hypothetical protein